jgi:hypothetical protein
MAGNTEVDSEPRFMKVWTEGVCCCGARQHDLMSGGCDKCDPHGWRRSLHRLGEHMGEKPDIAKASAELGTFLSRLGSGSDAHRDFLAHVEEYDYPWSLQRLFVHLGHVELPEASLVSD